MDVHPLPAHAQHEYPSFVRAHLDLRGIYGLAAPAMGPAGAFPQALLDPRL